MPYWGVLNFSMPISHQESLFKIQITESQPRDPNSVGQG